MKNVFYFEHINNIGGVETMFWELAKKYRDRDIAVFYKTGSPDQINRLSQYIRVQQLGKEVIECDKAFFNYQLAIDKFKAKEYYQILHADYKQQKIKPHLDDRLTGYIAVSKTVAKSFKELTGIEPIICYNPITITKDDLRPVLHLISATRLTKEKGKWRMEELAKKLAKSGLLFEWDIYTNDTNAINLPGVNYRKPNLNIRPYIAKADVVVQLSDSEGWCYTINEALCLGTKVLATPCPSLKEMGGEDIIYLNFDLSNINEVIKKLSKLVEPVKTDFSPKKDCWDKLLAEGKSTYDISNLVMVQCSKRYFDKEFNKSINEYEKYWVSTDRAKILLAHECAVIYKGGLYD